MGTELRSLLSELQRFDLPCLTKDSFKAGGVLISDLPPAVSQSGSVYQILDYYVTKLFPAQFEPPLAFQWAGGPDNGRTIRSRPDEEDFNSADEFEQAEQKYWEHFGEPEPWQELVCPIRAPGANHGPKGEGPLSLRAFLLEKVQWSLNNKRYRVHRHAGSEVRVPYSSDPGEQQAIKAQEAEHQRQRTNLIDLFVTGVSDPYRFFHTNHVLDEQSAQSRGWSLQRDEVFAFLDQAHLRVLWTLRDREYG